MKKINRIRKNEEFQKIIAKKQSVANQSFVIYYALKKEKDNARIGISVSKKIGNAIIRNKVKRQVRMLVKETIDLNGKFDYIIIVRQKFLAMDFSKNKKELYYALNKIKGR